MNTSLFNIPQCSTKSALERNLNAKASSKNPKITLSVPIHPPDLGRDFKTFGNTAKSAKGKAKAVPKPIIPKSSWPAFDVEDREPTNKLPKIGPVQEKETIANVNAMKKMPITPPVTDLESEILPHLPGKVSS
ncbi:hypothetical protein ElyMa_002323300 [Elysia marginata]|uniref:Uncharacterized protein n=1 Tax=Elysia marginata TaxID=1093978 RepID=A0AAV4G537_9GAST|nr:hypothetical protein ElyMa_002323300 [Elysia marginata]